MTENESSSSTSVSSNPTHNIMNDDSGGTSSRSQNTTASTSGTSSTPRTPPLPQHPRIHQINYYNPNNQITVIQYLYYFYHYYKEQYQRNPSLLVFIIFSIGCISFSMFMGLPITSFFWLSGLVISSFILLQTLLLLVSGRQYQRNNAINQQQQQRFNNFNGYPGNQRYQPLFQQQQQQANNYNNNNNQDSFYFSRFSHLINPSLNLQLTLIDRDFNSNDYEMLLALDNQNITKGASQDQIDLLPIHSLKTQKDLDSLLNQEIVANNCSICLENYSIGDSIRTLPCIHHFHSKCVDKWLKLKPLCPICKNDVF